MENRKVVDVTKIMFKVHQFYLLKHNKIYRISTLPQGCRHCFEASVTVDL